MGLSGLLCLSCLLKWKLGAGNDILVNTAKIHNCHSSLVYMLFISYLIQSFDVLHLCHNLLHNFLLSQSAYLISASYPLQRRIIQTLDINMPLQKQHRNPAYYIQTAFTFSRYCIFLYRI